MNTSVRLSKEFFIKEVTEEDHKVLFELLEQRTHSISHNGLPSRDEHLNFVRSNPYRYWALITKNNSPIGTTYIQEDNSIGINLLNPEKLVVYKILQFIQSNFQPLEEIKSKVPSYFYVNVPNTNIDLSQILLELDALPIQISYKIKNS